MNRPMGFLLVVAIFVGGCGGSERYPQLPAKLDQDSLLKQTVGMTAERYTFSPKELHVKAGTLVTLEVTALDGIHGVSLPDYGIDVSLPERQPVKVRFYAATKGEHRFTCSHLCGIDHFWMGGKIVAE